MKHIGIDCRFAHLHAGLGRYTKELVTHLLQIEDSSVKYTLFVHSLDDIWLQNIQHTTYNVQLANFPHYSLAEQIHFPRLIKKSNIDLLFSPHFNVPLLCPVPFIVTIHDLILHRYPNQASILKQYAYKLVMQNAIRNAQSIIAVSTFTKEEVIDIYGARYDSKTSIIPEAPGPGIRSMPADDCQKILKDLNITKPFFLFVGNAKEHKNVQMLLDAYAQANTEESLVLVTGGKEANALHVPKNVTIIEEISDDILSALYSSARCFVSASLYEGFGLPLVEAQICGCPVIACNRSAIPETAGPEAVLVEPTVEALTVALKNPPNAPKNFQPHSWEKIAQNTREILT